MGKQRGFTLVELLIVMPGIFIVSAFLAAFLVSLYQDILIKNGKIEMGIEAQNALFNMRDDLFFANRFAGEIQPDATDSHAPAGGWNAMTQNLLIVYEASYDKNRQTPDRQLIFRRDVPFACTDERVIENQFSTNTFVYFVSNRTLYKRTLVPDQSANCLTTFRLTSCPATNATPTCPADIPLVTNVESISYKYYDRTGDLFDYDTLNDDIDKFIQVQRAEIELVLSNKVAAEPITSRAKITIKKAE